MNVLVAFGIGTLVFVSVVALTAYFLKSASLLESAKNRGVTVTQEHVDDVVDDVNDPDAFEKMSEES